MKFYFVIIILVLLHCGLCAQNLVSNSSFERSSSCPDDFFQIDKSLNWFSPYCESFGIRGNGQATYFSGTFPCNNPITSVPRNVLTNQGAHTGFSYAGILVINSKIVYTEFRHYLETKLQQPLQAGAKYYFSAFYNLALGDYYKPEQKNICFRTDSLGVHFSDTIINNPPDCKPLLLSAQILDSKKSIMPEGRWYEMTGCYTATGNEQYITLGNFGHNAFSDCSTGDTTGYYLLIDDVTLIAAINKKTDTVLCNGKDWQINAQDFRNEYSYLNGWQYRWNDGDTSRIRKFTGPGSYTLHISNKDCFEDVYQFDITYGDCNCKDYIATAFTPNGDKVNDEFLPKIVCITGQVAEYNFSIYNRWGQKLFSTSSTAKAWDGKFNGHTVNPGAYVYVLQYKTGAKAQVLTVKGTVLVLE